MREVWFVVLWSFFLSIGVGVGVAYVSRALMHQDALRLESLIAAQQRTVKLAQDLHNATEGMHALRDFPRLLRILQDDLSRVSHKLTQYEQSLAWQRGLSRPR